MDKLAEPRRRFGYHEKRAILEEHFNLGLSLSVLSRKHQIHPVTLYSWKRSLSMTESTIKSKDNMEEILAEMERLRKENKHLARAVSTLTVDKAILTDAIEILKKKSQQRALLKQQMKS